MSKFLIRANIPDVNSTRINSAVNFMQIQIIFALADRIWVSAKKSSSSSFNQCRFNSL